MPVTLKARTSTASGAFALVEIVVTCVLVGLLVVGALCYFQGIAADSRMSVAIEDMHRIADDIQRWQLSHLNHIASGTSPTAPLPKTTAELRFGGKEVLDPWGTPYQIQQQGGYIVCAGPNRFFETTEFSRAMGDDLAVRFAPPAPHQPADT